MNCTRSYRDKAGNTYTPPPAKGSLKETQQRSCDIECKYGTCSAHNGKKYVNLSSSSALCSVGEIGGTFAFANGKWTWSCNAKDSNTSCSAIKINNC